MTVQCKFTAITELESQNNVWKRIQKGMPAGQLSFLLRAGSDTLPTPLNLRRWRLRPGTKCPLCGNLWPTVQHILNGCPVSLSQERYTWRHDSALKILAQGLGKCLQPGERLFADLPEMRATDNPPATIPAEILDTSARPDIVIVGDGEITLIELTVPYNSPDCLNWLPHTHSALRQQIPSLSKSTATQLLDLAAKAIVTASHRIFCACLNPTWN